MGPATTRFSKINLDKVLAKIKATPNVTIFSIGTGTGARITGNARSGMFGPKEIDYLQADNQMSTFARMTGGMSFFPRFAGRDAGYFPLHQRLHSQPVRA